MPPLNLSTIVLPDLLDLTLYPVVDHDHTCLDTWTPSKTCFGTDLHRLRPYALPTEDLNRVLFPWARRNLFQVPQVPLIPPSLGTLCPTLKIDDPTISTIFGTGDFDLDSSTESGDHCRPLIIPTITFPCTQVQPGTKTVTMAPGATSATWVQTVTNNPAGNSCIAIIADTLTVPCGAITPGTVTTSLSGGLSGSLSLSVAQTGCNASIGASLTLSNDGGSNPGISAGFFVGTTDSHTPDPSSCCVATYPPGSVVPVFDRWGAMGPPNTQLSPVDNVFTNRTDLVLTDGDPIFLEHLGDQVVGDPVQWVVIA